MNHVINFRNWNKQSDYFSRFEGLNLQLRKNYLPLRNLVKLALWSILYFKVWKVNASQLPRLIEWFKSQDSPFNGENVGPWQRIHSRKWLLYWLNPYLLTYNDPYEAFFESVVSNLVSDDWFKRSLVSIFVHSKLHRLEIFNLEQCSNLKNE